MGQWQSGAYIRGGVYEEGPVPGVWKQAALRRREEVARSRILGAVAIGWLFTVPTVVVSMIAIIDHRNKLFLEGGAAFLVIGLAMAGVTELMRRGSQIAIGAFLGLALLPQIQAARLLRGSYLGWSALIWLLIIGALANGLWGALELERLRHQAGVEGST